MNHSSVCVRRMFQRLRTITSTAGMLFHKYPIYTGCALGSGILFVGVSGNFIEVPNYNRLDIIRAWDQDRAITNSLIKEHSKLRSIPEDDLEQAEREVRDLMSPYDKLRDALDAASVEERNSVRFQNMKKAYEEGLRQVYNIRAAPLYEHIDKTAKIMAPEHFDQLIPRSQKNQRYLDSGKSNSSTSLYA